MIMISKRDEMIAFVEAYVNDEISVQFKSIMPATGETCLMFIHATKERIKTILQTYFTEDLIGHMPKDETIHQILGWSAAPRFAITP